MAEIRIYNNFLKEDYLTLEYDASKSVLEQVQSLIDTDAYTKQLVECYDTETGETYYASLEDNVTDPSIIITVNNKDYTNEYIVKENDIICVYFLPLGKKVPIGTIIGAAVGILVGIVLIATGWGAGAGGYTLASGISLIGGLVGIGSMIGMTIDMVVAAANNKPSVTKSITEKGKEGEQKPDIKGAENKSILGNVYPYVIGKHLVTPFIIGDPYTEYIGQRGEDAYIRVLYCVGYGPLKLTDFKLGDFYLAYNRPNKNSDRKTLLRGLLKGYSTNNFDDGDILDFWENNDVELEIIQHNPYDERYESIIYPEKIVQEEVNANILFVSDKSLSETAKITYKNISFPKNFRTNTVVFTESCPKEFEITLDAVGGLFATYTRTENSGDTSITKTKYSPIPIYICAQWRPYNKNNEAPQSNGSDYSSWRNITTWNGVDCGITLDTEKMIHDIQSHQGNKLINSYPPTGEELEEIYGNFRNNIVSDIGKFSGEEGISQMRFTAKVTLSDEDIKLITSKDNTMKSIEVRVIRVSPCYIDEKSSTSDSSGGESAQTYSDIIKFHTIKTKCFDEQEYRDTGEVVPIKVQTKEQYEKFCYIAIKAKADATGNIATQLRSLNCIAEAFSPIWDFKNKKWLPENVQRTSLYVGFGEKLDEPPENWDKTYSEYLVIEDGTFVFNTSPQFDFTQYKPSNGEKDSVRLEVSKEMYEICRQKGHNWIATKTGTNFTSKIKDIVYNDDIIIKNGYTGNFLQKEGSKYNDSLSASAFMLSCVGPQCGPLALGYEQINLLSLGDWAEETVALKDGSLDEDDNPIEIKMEANAYIYQGMKLEEILKSIALTGRAVFTYDETGKILVVMDKSVKYPSGVISQQNCEDISVTYNYESLPAGLRIDFNDENDGYITNNFYCWSDGNSIKEYSGQVENYQIPYVTNPAQAWSLGRYFLACRILNKELVTAKLGPEGVNYNIGDVLALQSDELLIGDGSGRIQEIISDENLIYGIITDSVFSVKGNVTDVNGTKISSEGVSIYQPKKFGKSRVITLRCAEVGYTVIIGDKEYVQIKGDTNVLLFENPIERDLSSDPSAKDVYSYNFDIGDVCLFGQYQKEYSKYKIIKIKPDKNNKYSVSLINYTDELYNYGAKLPTFQNNMTTVPVLSDGINLSNLPDNVKDLAEFAKKEELNQYITGESIKAPSTPIFLVKAEKDGIKFTILPNDGTMANIIKSYTVYIKKGYGKEIEFTVTESELYYKFNRDEDFYPEATDLDSWAVKIKATNVYNKTSEWSDLVKVDTDNYGTWKLTKPFVNYSVNDRTVFLQFAQNATSSNKEIYGEIRYGITIARPDIDKDDQEKIIFFTPNETGDPFDNELNYKVPDLKEPIWRTFSYSQQLPLKGQNSSEDKKIENTLYGFRIVAENQAGRSESVDIYITALATSIVDLVKANETTKEAYISSLSAISANLGVISQGAFGGNQYNIWALSNIPAKDSPTGEKLPAGYFRVGGEDKYILVYPITDDFGNIIDYDFILHVGALEITTEATSLNSELIIYNENISVFDRTRITTTGTYYEHRNTPTSEWYAISKLETSGLLSKSLLSKDSLVIANTNITERRRKGLDIGKPYLSDNCKVYHFDEDLADQNGNIEYDLTSINPPILVGTGDSASIEKEDIIYIDFTPAILAVAPYSEVGKALYGQYNLKFNTHSENNCLTVDFWLQFIYAEGQSLFTIGTEQDYIQIISSSAEPNYNEPLRDGNGLLLEPPYNYETTTSEEIVYNHALSTQNDSYIVHGGISNYEIKRLAEFGEQFTDGQWQHIAVVFEHDTICVYIGHSKVTFPRYSTTEKDFTINLGDEEMHSLIIDELMIDNSVAEGFDSFFITTDNKIPFGALDYKEKYFILDSGDSEFLTNIFDTPAFKEIIPVGTIQSGIYTDIPDGWLLCDGSTFDTVKYPRLYEVLKTDILPDLRGRFLEGANNDLGTYKEAGLPNITGSHTSAHIPGSGGGALSAYGTGYTLYVTGAGSHGAVSLDASKGETKTDGTLKTEDEHHVYGSSDTVQPASFMVNYIIRAK